MLSWVTNTSFWKNLIKFFFFFFFLLQLPWVFIVVHVGFLHLQHVWFSRCSRRALQCAGSVVAGHRRGCPETCGILYLRPGIEPSFPALEGGFLTAGPPAQSLFRLVWFSSEVSVPLIWALLCILPSNHSSFLPVTLYLLVYTFTGKNVGRLDYTPFILSRLPFIHL